MAAAQEAFKVSEATYQTLVLAYNDAAVKLKEAENALNTAKANCNYVTYEQAYNTANSAYEAARKSLDTLESTYKTALKNVTNASEQLAKAKTNDTLEDLRDQLDECTITATANGTITAVNATVGSAPGGSTTAGSSALFAIQDTDNLKVSVTIDEYDIKTIETGMDAIILSDATGDTEIPGYVSQISLTATTTQSTTGFGAEITVDGKNSGLLIGMSAKVEIIISEKSNVYSVPYDAVGKDENGNDVVYVKNGDTFEPVIVTVGLETDYYIEISGEALSEGMEIRNSADESSIDQTETQQSAEAVQGAVGFSVAGDMGGSAMASGGGTPPSGGGGAPGGRG